MDQTTESPELKTLKKVIQRLEKGSIPYMLTGSMALNFYGHPLFERIYGDLFPEPEREKIRAFLSAD